MPDEAYCNARMMQKQPQPHAQSINLLAAGALNNTKIRIVSRIIAATALRTVRSEVAGNKPKKCYHHALKSTNQTRVRQLHNAYLGGHDDPDDGDDEGVVDYTEIADDDDDEDYVCQYAHDYDDEYALLSLKGMMKLQLLLL